MEYFTTVVLLFLLKKKTNNPDLNTSSTAAYFVAPHPPADLLWPVYQFMCALSAVRAQHPLLASSEQRGLGWWLQPAGSHRTAQAELSATPVLH